MKVSVIVPAYNEAENIGRCLASLSHQTIPRSEYELIVVDGGSSDATVAEAEPLCDLVFVQESERVGGARNDGVKRANAPSSRQRMPTASSLPIGSRSSWQVSTGTPMQFNSSAP